MIMMKEKEVHAFNIMILTMITNGPYHNHFLMLYLIMLKICQCLHKIRL